MNRKNHNIPKEERENVLSETKNIRLIKNILGHDFPIANDDDLLVFYNKNFKLPSYVETEKFGIIFTMKGGSSYITNILDDLKLSVVPSTLNSAWNHVFKSVMRIKNADIETTQYKEFLNIVNGKSKKDLILVTRNPIYKWVSGVYQEMEVEYKNSKTLRYFINSSGSKEIPSNEMDDLEDSEFSEFVFNVIKAAFDIGETSTWAHAGLYNEMFYNFLELNPNIDKSKLKIIDIDSQDGDLTDILSMYYPEIKMNSKSHRFSTHRNLHKRVLSGVQNKISHDSSALENDIKYRLSQDYYYYILLKHKYQKYLFKK